MVFELEMFSQREQMNKMVQLQICFVEPWCVPAMIVWEPFFRCVLGLAPSFLLGVWGGELKGREKREGGGGRLLTKQFMAISIPFETYGNG